MTRTLILLTGLLVVGNVYAVELSECALQRYVDWSEGIGRGCAGSWGLRVCREKHIERFGFKWSDALVSRIAIASDGSWATGTGRAGHLADRAALKNCNERFNTSSCKVLQHWTSKSRPPSYRKFTERSRGNKYWCTTKDAPPYLATTKECKAENGVYWFSRRDAERLYLLISTDSMPIFGSPEDDANCGTTTVSTPTPSPDSDRKLLLTGTGFVVNKNFIATADHVLRMNDSGDVCNSVSIMYRHDEYQTTIADLDPANDIGLLKLSKPISSTAKIRNDPDLRLGETAVNYGFPLFGELSSSAKITRGAVNSLAGYNNNSAFIQFDAASQFGNSGGPVLDVSGNVIGVVSAKLDDSENQLVNFATKSTILEGFLKANKVQFEKADLGEELKLPDIAEKAETFTVLVGCWE